MARNKYLWTFRFCGAAKILNQSEEDEPSVAVISSTYSGAVKKVLKMGIPNVGGEEHLKFSSAEEGAYDDGDEQVQLPE
jgi:hypothetical protein